MTLALKLVDPQEQQEVLGQMTLAPKLDDPEEPQVVLGHFDDPLEPLFKMNISHPSIVHNDSRHLHRSGPAVQSRMHNRVPEFTRIIPIPRELFPSLFQLLGAESASEGEGGVRINSCPRGLPYSGSAARDISDIISGTYLGQGTLGVSESGTDRAMTDEIVSVYRPVRLSEFMGESPLPDFQSKSLEDRLRILI
jgi:hypothetical protein